LTLHFGGDGTCVLDFGEMTDEKTVYRNVQIGGFPMDNAGGNSDYEKKSLDG
jgi:hypothetical protein